MDTDLGEICGDCRYYERGNAWSGFCIALVAENMQGGASADDKRCTTSPGRKCQHEPSKFTPSRHMATGADGLKA